MKLDDAEQGDRHQHALRRDPAGLGGGHAGPRPHLHRERLSRGREGVAEVPERDQAERLQGERRAHGRRFHRQGDRADRQGRRFLHGRALRRPPQGRLGRGSRRPRARHRRRRLLLGGDVCGRHRAARDRPGRARRAAAPADERPHGGVDAARHRSSGRRRRAALRHPGQRRRLRHRPDPRPGRLLPAERRRQGAGDAGRHADHGLRLVEQHAVGHAARGAGGGAVRTPRRPGRAGARPAPVGVHDPRPAVRLRARHGADPRREPAPDRLGRRRPARAGRLDRRAPRDREIPAPAGRARPHPRVGRGAQHRADACASTRAARPTTASCAATWSTSAPRASSARCASRARSRRPSASRPCPRRRRGR